MNKIKGAYSKLKKWIKVNPEDMDIINLKVKSPEGKIPIRIYYPKINENVKCQKSIMFLHGGFVAGNLETHENLCQRLARETSRVIISVDYRQAPKHTYPIPIRDCYCAYYYICKNSRALKLDKNQIAIGGSGAGGNLALGVMEMCLRRKNKGTLPTKMLLMYPLTDMESILMEDYTESAIKNAHGHNLTTKELESMTKTYIPYFDKEAGAMYPHLLGNPYLSPVKSDLISHYPETMIISAGKDILRDENFSFTIALAQNGVEFQHYEYKNMSHAFMNFDFKETKNAFENISEFTKRDS